MWRHLFSGFQIVHGVFAVLAAIAFFRYWKRTGFWFPKYIHVLAGVSFILGVGFVWLVSTAPVVPKQQPSLAGQLLLTLLFPAIVYIAFVFYGGQHAAFTHSALRSAPCPFCGEPLPVRSKKEDAVTYLDQQCCHCKQTLP